DPARTDSGPGQIGKAALSNRSTQGYLGLPVAPQLPQNPLRRILNPFPKAGSPKIYIHEGARRSLVSGPGGTVARGDGTNQAIRGTGRSVTSRKPGGELSSS